MIARSPRVRWIGATLLVLIAWLIAPVAEAAPAADTGPVADAIAQAIDPTAPQPGSTPPASGAGTALQVLVMMTVLSLLPAIALTMTCFTRIIIVFSFLRQALGLPGAPPNQVLTGMALFITAFVMTPTISQVYDQAIVPLQREEIGMTEALDRASKPMVAFMLKHTADEDLRLFHDVADRPRPESREDVSLFVVVPAFTLSEVRTAFTMGFLILVPFLVIDLVVSSVLMAMGMVMLPPALVTLPLKVLVFILADGWGLVIGSLVKGLTTS
ncbi:MAG TPA: flagellar type III secretion system pore protein FliP [Nannocystaceae bacterium]|nr:flagellar type III secretion system pore protein FliP [Nannocystaceae bacterium]